MLLRVSAVSLRRFTCYSIRMSDVRIMDLTTIAMIYLDSILTFHWQNPGSDIFPGAVC